MGSWRYMPLRASFPRLHGTRALTTSQLPRTISCLLLCSHRPTPTHDLSPSIAASRTDETIDLHLLDHPSRPWIAHAQPTLNQRCRSLTGRQNQLFRLLIDFAKRVFLFRRFLFRD